MGVIVIVTLIFHVVIAKVIASRVITSTSSHLLDKFTARTYRDNCGCIQFDCGCCQHIEWNVISLNGTLCANTSYLEHEYGISVTVTYNDFVIINETVSARNPPPICFGEDIVDSIEIEVCLHIYDIDIGYDTFHACFETFCKFMHIKMSTIKLGCVSTKLWKQLEYTEDNRIVYFLRLLHERKTEGFEVPNVVMV